MNKQLIELKEDMEEIRKVESARNESDEPTGMSRRIDIVIMKINKLIK